MQTTFYLSTLTYQISVNFWKQNKEKPGDITAQSEQVAALGMIGLTLGKCFSTYVLSKVAAQMTQRISLLITGSVCFIAMTVYFFEASLSQVFFKL